MALPNPCCCCPDVGFDRAAWPGVTSCCTGMSPVINIKDDVTRLTGRKIVFAGHIPGACSNAIYFAAGDWAAVAAYINNGGRLWLNLEYYGCLADGANSNAFL